ncbi:MAG: hypothetical protein GWN93_26740 [Deltaproteobacteria bacterium]|nr:hypothetical protein [Deltaproteobacteria bacterium]
MSGADLIDSFAETVTVTRFNPSIQQQTLEFDADFVVGNVIDLDVDGAPISSVPFNADQATTMSDLAAAIQASAKISSAVVTGAREITITAEHEGNEFLISAIIVTGGGSQANGSITGISGGYVDGVFQQGSTSQFDIKVSMQPFSSKELLLLPEGERTRRHMKAYTATRLYTAEQSQASKADRLDYDGTVFEVQEVERWKLTDLNHFKLRVTELN